MVRVLIARPLPVARPGTGRRRSGRGRWQSRHGSENAKPPWLRLACPVPWQVGQAAGRCPAWRRCRGRSGSGRRWSAAAAPWRRRPPRAKASVTSVSTSAPRRARVRAAVRPCRHRRPNRPPKMSPSARRCRRAVLPPNRSPKSKVNPPPGPPPPPAERRKPPAPNSGRASSYSLRRLVVGQHVVGLGDSLNLLLGRRVARVGVRVVLRASLRYAFLISSGGGVLGDAEDLVVVLLQEVLGAHRVLSFSAAHRVSAGVSRRRADRARRGSATATRAGRSTRSPIR